MLCAIEISAHVRMIYFLIERDPLMGFIWRLLICVERDENLFCVINIK